MSPDSPAHARVLLVDDDPLVRAGLRLLLADEPAIEIVGEASDGDEVGDAVAASDPDVVLMDVRMPRRDGVEATARLRAEHAGRPAVIMLTTFNADATVLAALRAGAGGYLLKHAAPHELIDAVLRAARGESVFTAAALGALVEHARATAEPHRAPDGPDPLARLSERERRIADAVAQGLSNSAIAADLFLSPGTVKADISAILATLGLQNRIQLAVLAHENRRDAR